MGRNYPVIDAFLTSFVQNNSERLAFTLAADIQIRFSTVGNHTGISNVLAALAWKRSFSVHTVTTSNIIPYEKDGYTFVGLIAHHLIANESGSELYPLCFGGKYVFTLDRSSGKIVHVSYAQEYQVENTLYIRGWRLAKHDPDLSCVSGFDLDRAYTAALSGTPEARAEQLSKVFFWAVDTGNLDFVDRMVTRDVHLLRFKTMSYGKFETYGAENAADFIKNCHSYYAMDQYSIAVRSVSREEGETLTVCASHLVPHRTGTKKLSVGTKFHSFFDEDITIVFVPEDGTYKIRDISIKKAVDVHYNGFDILHL